MLGRKVSTIFNFPRNFLYRYFGILDVSARHKWSIAWKHLQEIPKDNKLRVLDAGCGTGLWSMEIAKRRPNWYIHGIDINDDSIQKARAYQKQLNISNCSFETADFLDFQPDQKFDVIISISSAHYLAQNGKGNDLFRNFSNWLKKDGELVLMGPRSNKEVPFSSLLPKFDWHKVFTEKDFEQYLENNNLKDYSLSPVMFSGITLLKQINSFVKKKKIFIAPLFTPIFYLLTAIDPLTKKSDRSLKWFLVAKKKSIN